MALGISGGLHFELSLTSDDVEDGEVAEGVLTQNETGSSNTSGKARAYVLGWR